MGRHRVARLMRQNGVTARPLRRFRKTTDSNHSLPIAPNLLSRNFKASRPNTVWVGDITYIWTASGWTYLAVVIDLFSRRVVGWAFDDTMRAELVQNAVSMALGQRHIESDLIFHSDRGSQYASGDFRKTLAQAGISQSMSRKGDCWDNAVAESFFATLKRELVRNCYWLTRKAARMAIHEYIEVFSTDVGSTRPTAFSARSILKGVFFPRLPWQHN